MTQIHALREQAGGAIGMRAETEQGGCDEQGR